MNDHQTPSAMAKRLEPRKLTNLSEILSCLSEFQTEETELSNSLGDLIAAREPMEASLDRLNGLLPDLSDLRSDAGVFSEKVSQTAKTADRVGSRVRSLDEEMRRVREAADRVSQVMELKVRVVYKSIAELIDIISPSLLYSTYRHLWSHGIGKPLLCTAHAPWPFPSTSSLVLLLKRQS